MSSKGVFIDRSRTKQILDRAARSQWVAFSSEDITTVGNAKRYCFVVSGKSAMLNLFYNKDGTTTISPTGQNQEYSKQLKLLVENNIHKKADVTASYSYKNISQSWLDRLIKYLESIEGSKSTQTRQTSNPPHTCYQFISPMGDRLTVNIYDNHTLTLQGKPAYLYGEALSLLSYCTDIPFDEIIKTTNTFHQIDTKPADIRAELTELLPQASETIDPTIIKLLSPSIVLKKLPIELEDYSCYAFPALRALEAYIKYLLGIKGIHVGHTFYGIFENESLTTDKARFINNNIIQHQLERLYCYFKSNRHVLFHADQILIGTTILENKQEADDIVNNVILLIEDSYRLLKPEMPNI
jgi:hypothetical protein